MSSQADACMRQDEPNASTRRAWAVFEIYRGDANLPVGRQGRGERGLY
jgi:hypothetical protein